VPKGVVDALTTAVETLFWQLVAPAASLTAKVQRIKEDVLGALRNGNAARTLHLYGSAALDVACQGCDIDLTLNNYGDEPCPPGYYGRRERLTIVHLLGKELEGAPWVQPGSVEVVPFARVPIVRFNHILPAGSADGGSANGGVAGGGAAATLRPEVTPCDLSVDGELALLNSRLLRAYLDCDARVRPLVFAVKQWAAACGMKDASHGFLSSYSLTLMVVYFLQRGVSPAVLPVLQEDHSQQQREEGWEGWEGKPPPAAMENNIYYQCAFYQDPADVLALQKSKGKNDMPLGEVRRDGRGHEQQRVTSMAIVVQRDSHWVGPRLACSFFVLSVHAYVRTDVIRAVALITFDDPPVLFIMVACDAAAGAVGSCLCVSSSTTPTSFLSTARPWTSRLRVRAASGRAAACLLFPSRILSRTEMWA
jgi:hypothetical protein